MRLVEDIGTEYYFDSTGTGSDDGDATITPTLGPGRWKKVSGGASAHAANHISGGSDPFTSSQLLEAVVKRIQTSTGPTTLTVGAIADGEFLKRSGTSVIGGTASGATQTWKEKALSSIVSGASMTNPGYSYHSFAKTNNTGGLDSEYWTQAGGSGTHSILDGASSPAVQGGARRLVTGTTADSFAYIYSGAATGQRTPFWFGAQTDDTTKKIGYGFRFRLATTPSTGCVAGIGLRSGQTPDSTSLVDAGYRHSISSTKWQLQVSDTSNGTSNAISSINIDTNWHTGIVYSNTTNWFFAVDGETAVGLTSAKLLTGVTGPWLLAANSNPGVATTIDIAEVIWVWENA